MAINGAIETVKLINARPNGVRTTDQDHTDTALHLFKHGGVKFLNFTNKREFSIVMILNVSTIVNAVIGNTITGGTSGATAVVVGFETGKLYVNALVGTFTNGETITDTGTYTATLTTVGSVAVTGGKAVIKATRITTNQFSPIPNKDLFANFEGFAPTDPTHQLRYPVKEIDVTGTKKVFIEIPVNNIEDMSLNSDQNGLNIGLITSATTYPSHPNYIPLWEITGGAWATATDVRVPFQIEADQTNMDLSNYGGDILAENIEATNIDVGTLNAETIILDGDDLETLITNISGGAEYINGILGEDATASDGKGSSFMGKGVTDVKTVTYMSGTTDRNLGEVDGNTRIGIFMNVPIDERSNILRRVSFMIKKVGSPVDNLTVSLFESDKVTPVLGFVPKTILNSSLSPNYSFITVDMSDTVLVEGGNYFVEIKRVGANNATNYYQMQGYSTRNIHGYYSQNYTASTFTRALNSYNINIEVNYGYDFTLNEIRRTDSRFNTTKKCDGILSSTGNQGDTRSIQSGGLLSQTTVDVESYYEVLNGLTSAKNISGQKSLSQSAGIGGGSGEICQQFVIQSITGQGGISTNKLRHKFSIGAYAVPVTCSLQIRYDNGGVPGDIMAVGNFTTFSVPYVFVTVTLQNNIYLKSGANYWFCVDFGAFPLAGAGYDTVVSSGYNYGVLCDLTGTPIAPGNLVLSFDTFPDATTVDNLNSTYQFELLGVFSSTSVYTLGYIIGEGILTNKVLLTLNPENQENYENNVRNEFLLYNPGTDITDASQGGTNTVASPDSVNWTRLYEFRVTRDGSYQIDYEYLAGASFAGMSYVARNGVQYSNLYSHTQAPVQLWIAVSIPLFFRAGDLIGFYASHQTGSESSGIRNATIKHSNQKIALVNNNNVL